MEHKKELGHDFGAAKKITKGKFILLHIIIWKRRIVGVFYNTNNCYKLTKKVLTYGSLKLSIINSGVIVEIPLNDIFF